MKRKRWFCGLGLIAATVSVVGLVLATTDQRLPAARRGLPKVTVIEASAGPAPFVRNLGGEKVVAPAPLTAAVKADLIKEYKSTTVMSGGEPASPFVTLSPKQLEVSGKGHLVFARPLQVTSGNVVMQEGVGGIGLTLQCQSNRLYLVDLSLSAPQPVTYHLKSFFGGQTKTYDFSMSVPDHLLFIFSSAQGGTYSFDLAASDSVWIFYACEVKEI